MTPIFNAKIISALSALDSAAALNDNIGMRAQYSSFYVNFGAGTSAGTVVIEGAHDPAFAGVWANLATVAWTVANSVKNVSIAGNHRALRARISVAIVGGTVDVYATVSQ